ncbi:hypothetical protein KAI92_01595 [Candidatus Parcubacteria bacterium]|nr:hypothetical protein [Candidatus Parcubacteria bacterium]
MSTFKQEAIKTITKLKDDATFDEISYEIYVLNQIRKGLDDFENKRTMTMDELLEDSKAW